MMVTPEVYITHNALQLCIWCKKIHLWLGGSDVRKISLSDIFLVSVFLIGLYREAYLCTGSLA